MNRLRLASLGGLILAFATISPLTAGDWANWRGPALSGVSPEAGFMDAWLEAGAPTLWRADFTGRSTPVVFNGRVCTNGRAGEGIQRQEMVACFDAESGEQLWEFRFNAYHTTVPWNRVGWANVTGDPETGYLYVQGVGGLFFCLDSRTGEIVWQKNLIEEYGFMEGYGGRTQTPVVDQGRLIVTFSNTSWGPEGKPLHRFRAFDKRTGELLWVSSPAPSQADKNTQSTPTIAVVNGRRLVISGNGGGGIFAIEARTGKKIWGFQLSKRGINTSVSTFGDRVLAAHSEENVDEGTMGRVVAIDATGSGDITQNGEVWRAPIGVGFSSAVVHGGRVYAVDNSANLHALDAESGEELWEASVGRVGKGSPAWVDGKILITEVNGRLSIVDPQGSEEDGTHRVILTKEFNMPSGRYAEIYGSPAVANGRIYLSTEEGLYAFGMPQASVSEAAIAFPNLEEEPVGNDAVPSTLLALPYEVRIRPAQSVVFRAEAFDQLGRALGELTVSWTLNALTGVIDENGRFTPDPSAGSQNGMVVATVGDLTAQARVRVLAKLPLSENFESTDVGSRPAGFIAYLSRFKVAELEGNRVLAKGPSPIKIHRHITFIGDPSEGNYAIEADLMGTRAGRKVSDIGLINSGYTMELMGAHQRLEVRSWASALRMRHQIPFTWQPDTWYRMKLKVAADDDKALIYGKVWPKGEPEPDEWTLSAEDPLPIRHGAPGLSGFSPANIYFDNIKVTENS